MNIIDDVKNMKRTEERICFKHQKKLTKTAEFQVKLLNSEMLQDWLWTYWINQFQISKFKIDSDI